MSSQFSTDAGGRLRVTPVRYLFIAFLFISSFISGQGIEPTSLQPTPYKNGILKGVIPYVDEFTGETLYIYQHVDSLVFIKDSIYVRNDSIFLRDGTGFAIVTDSIYIVTGVSKDTIKLRDGEGYVLIDKSDYSKVRGTGAATRVAWWGGSDSLSSDAAFYWDNTNKRLGIGTASPTTNLEINGLTPKLRITDLNDDITQDETIAELKFYSKEADANRIAGFINSVGDELYGRKSYLSFGTSVTNNANATEQMRLHSTLRVNALDTDLTAPTTTGTTRALVSDSNGDISFSTLFPTGSGTVNYLPLWTPDGSTLGNSIAQQNGNGIGIGGSPSYKFDVLHSGFNQYAARVYNSGIGDRLGLLIQSDESAVGRKLINISSAGASNAFNVHANGYIGIGVDVPINSILHVKADQTRIKCESTANNSTSRFNILTPQRNIEFGVNPDGNTTNWFGIYDALSNKIPLRIDNISSTIALNWVFGQGLTKTLNVNGGIRAEELAGSGNRMVIANSSGELSTTTMPTSYTFGNGLTESGGSVTANINGTQNRVAKFTSQYSVGNSQIYTVGDSLVGINQNTPQYHLDVTGKFRVTNRDGMPVTGAGFTSNGQLVAYNLDTALATPNTYLSSGMYIDIDGTGTMADPYEINNTKPENTTVKDGLHLDFEELANDTITASIIPGSIGATELESTSVVAGTYNYATITVDGDGRITSASNNTDQGITSIATASPITGGAITSSGTIGINNAAADGSTKGASTYTASDFNDNGSGLISIDYTNGQAASGSTKGFLTSSDWNTFNSKEPAISLGTADQYWRGDKTWQNFNTSARNAISLTTTGSSGASTYNSSTGVLNVPNYTLSGLGGMDKWGYVAPSGSGGNVIAYVLDDQVINYYNGNGITIGRASGTHDVTITNTKPFDFLGVQANSGATGTLSNFGTLNLIGAGGTTVSRSGSNFTISSSSGSGTVTNVSATAGNGISTSVTNPTTTPNITVTNTKPFDYIGLQANSGSIYSLPNTWVLNLTGAGGTTVTRSNNSFTISSASTDNQTLSWSSPNLSISGGNSVTLPVLPSGSVNNTLRHDGSGWSATSLLSTTTSRVDVNSWPSTVNLGSKLLVNGGIQYNQSGFAATEISGRDAQGGLTGVSVGSGLTLSSGTLSATPIYAEVSYIGPSSTIGSWTSISFNQTAISNGMSTSSSGITIPSNGNYKIEYSVWGAFGNNTLTGYSGMQTRVFSGGVKGTRTERVYHSNTQPMDLSISHSCIFASLTAGNLVNLDVQQFSNSGAALTISAANLIVTKL